MPKKRMNSIAKNRRHVYERLKGKGMSKSTAAKIANAGKTFAGRSRMAKKAARTRKRR
jgi:DNA polymerase III alpha subunit